MDVVSCRARSESPQGGEQMATTTPLGFLGLGVMGGPMARNLVKAGHAVAGYDTDAARLARFVAAGGKGAGSPAEVGRQAEIVFLSLPTGDVVRAVVLGP